MLPRFPAEILSTLQALYGPQELPPPANALEWVLWENVVYLADDAKRAEAFAMLRTRVGTRPEEILAAPHEVLRDIARHSIVPDNTAIRLTTIAEVALAQFAGDVDS